MKKYLFIVLLLIISIRSFSQQYLEVEILNLHYQNGNSIDNCGVIDFQSNTNITLVFDVKLTRPASQATGDGNIHIYTQQNSAFGLIERADVFVADVLWYQNTFTKYDIQVSLNSYDYDISGGVFFANYSTNGGGTYNSCHYSIIKDEVPTFEISPSSATVGCNSSSQQTFSVSNVYNSPGNLQYFWRVGDGWKNSNGDVIINDFWTYNNTITLTPYQYPPSNVHVTPYLDGVPYDELVSTVSLGSFNTNNQIIGNNTVCSTANYHLQNSLPNGWSVNWSLESTNIASITQNGNNATVTRNTNQSGEVTIKVTFTNSCNQTVSKTLDVFVGHQPVNLNNIIGDEEICSNETKTYRINIPTCIGDVNWSVSPNLHITDESYDYITVEENYNSTSNFGYVNVNIPDLNINLEKIVFIGVPLNSEQLFIRKISSYNLYSYRWSKFKVHPMIDFDDIQESLHFEWLIPNSQVRHFIDTSIIDIKPNSLGVLNIGVRACNDCGCGNWKYKTFNVISTPSNGNGNNITEIIRPR